MKMSGEQRIAASRQRVWEALNDPEVLRQCIPGCQSLTREADDRLAAVAEVKIGPIGARFKGFVTLSDLDPPNGYVITGQGSGGVAGSAKGGAKVRLRDDSGGTVLSYDVDAEVGGRMAQLGGPLIDATARQMAQQFFMKFEEVVAGEVSAPAPVAAAASSAVSVVAAPDSVSAPVPAAARTSLWGWVAALLAAILVGYVLGVNGARGGMLAVVMVLLVIVAAAAFEAGRRGGGR